MPLEPCGALTAAGVEVLLPILAPELAQRMLTTGILTEITGVTAVGTAMAMLA